MVILQSGMEERIRRWKMLWQKLCQAETEILSVGCEDSSFLEQIMSSPNYQTWTENIRKRLRDHPIEQDRLSDLCFPLVKLGTLNLIKDGELTWQKTYFLNPRGKYTKAGSRRFPYHLFLFASALLTNPGVERDELKGELIEILTACFCCLLSARTGHV